MTALLAWLAVLSGLLVAVGIGMIYPPAGVIAIGVEGLAAAYTVAYLRVRSGRR